MRSMFLVILLVVVNADNGDIPTGHSNGEVNENHNVHHLSYQGDMILPTEYVLDGHRVKRQAMAWKKFPHSLWKEGVNYYIDRSQYQSQMLYNDVRTAFQRAAKLWESNTCINFTEDASGVNSNALIYSETKSLQSIKVDQLRRNVTFNGEPAIKPKDEMYMQTLGSPFPSFNEYAMVNELYRCKELCKPETSAKCEIGGYPHPRDCTKCICPTGYGGVLCNERPSGCGKTVQASSNWTDLVDILNLSDDDPNEYTMCNYWIESPEGTTIEVKLRYYPPDYSDYGCRYAGFEIKTNKDQTCTGYRWCTPGIAGKVFRSYTNRVPLITYSSLSWGPIKAIFEYRYVSARSDA